MALAVVAARSCDASPKTHRPTTDIARPRKGTCINLHCLICVSHFWLSFKDRNEMPYQQCLNPSKASASATISLPRRLLTDLGEHVGEAWFPQRCLLCLSRCRGDFCENCQPLLDQNDQTRPQRCLRCGIVEPNEKKNADMHRCTHPRPAWSRLWVGMAYQVPLDGLLMLGKFANDPSACQALGRWLGIRMPGSAFFGISDGPPLVVPIPSTPSKLRLRGYNPVEQIARGWVQIAKRYGHPAPRLECKLLLRHDHGPSQSRRSAKDRALAPQASASASGTGSGSDSGSGSDLGLEHSAQTAGFYLNPSVLAAHGQSSHVLLLDDVMTTGSTLAAACLSLRAAAIQSISVAVLMRR